MAPSGSPWAMPISLVSLLLRASTALSTCGAYEAEGRCSRTSLRIAYASGTSELLACRCAMLLIPSRSAADVRTRRLPSVASASASRGLAHRRRPGAPSAGRGVPRASTAGLRQRSSSPASGGGESESGGAEAWRMAYMGVGSHTSSWLRSGASGA